MDEQERYSLAALAGAGLYAVRFFVGTWQRRALLVISGWSFANWVGPVLVDLFHLQTEPQVLGFAFVCGFMGDKALTIMVGALERYIRRRLTALLKK